VTVPDSVATPPPPTGPPTDRPRPKSRVTRWWLDLPVRRKSLAVLGLPLLALVPAMVLTGVLAQREPAARAASRQAVGVANDARAVLQHLTDAGLAARSFAATSDERYLVPYEVSLAQIGVREAELQADAPPEVQPAVADLSAAVDTMLGPLEWAVTVGNQAALGGEEVNRQVAAGAAGMSEARRAVDTITTEMDAVVLHQREHLDDLADWQAATLAVGLVVGAAAGVAGAILSGRGIARRLEQVADNADRYSRGEAPMPTPVTCDEIGQMEEKLAEASARLDAEHTQALLSRDEAMAATRAKDEFLSRMSHELRTPLTAVIGFGQLLQLSDLSDDDRESADLVVKAGRHLLSLINEVLDIARIESGHLSLSLEPIALHDVVAESLALMGPAADARQVTVEDGTDAAVVVMADRQRVKQVLLNLVSNAVKYNREGGRITLRTAVHEPGTVRLSVSDTGYGIGPDGLTRIFAPFERLEAVHTTVEGTGVGLALSKSLVEAMGGTIGVTSEPGVGSTFWIDLIEAEAPVIDGLPVEPMSAAAAARVGGTVLYIEDNPANVRLMQRLFRDRPETLEVVAQGRLGVDLARQLQPRLILLDLHLPDLDGHEVLARLRADPTTTQLPVVVLSADASPRRAERLVDQGAVAYVTKPIDVAELLALVERFTSS
jgi:signal transduction histidine kinase